MCCWGVITSDSMKDQRAESIGLIDGRVFDDDEDDDAKEESEERKLPAAARKDGRKGSKNCS